MLPTLYAIINIHTEEVHCSEMDGLSVFLTKREAQLYLKKEMGFGHGNYKIEMYHAMPEASSMYVP